MSSNREIAKLMLKNGFVLKRNNKHCVWINALGNMLVTSSTPSDHRAIVKIKSQLKRLQIA